MLGLASRAPCVLGKLSTDCLFLLCTYYVPPISLGLITYLFGSKPKLLESCVFGDAMPSPYAEETEWLALDSVLLTLIILKVRLFQSASFLCCAAHCLVLLPPRGVSCLPSSPVFLPCEYGLHLRLGCELIILTGAC